MQFYQDLFQRYQVTPVQGVPDAFETGRAAFYVRPQSAIPILQNSYLQLAWGVTPLPLHEDAD